MDFTRMKELVVPEGVVKKVEIGGRTVWEKKTEIPSLGGSLTAEQSAAIRAGDFTKTPVGEYWTFTDVPYTYLDENNSTVSDTYSGIMRVADCDYYLNTGDTPLTAHHVVVVPDKYMFTNPMHSSNSTSAGYVGSKMYTTYLRRAKAIFNACFGTNHVLNHREFLVKTVTNGKESAGAWYNSTVELMDERMVYGTASYANTSLTSVSDRQLSLFKNNPKLVCTGQYYYYWLRTIASKDSFLIVYTLSVRNMTQATNINGVRPYALIY